MNVKVQDQVFDILVIGGGINGVAAARDASGRGLKVLLCDKGDLACQTSSASSKLIHGGLRYLAQYHFKLVYQALNERTILQRQAPFLVRPLKFIMPTNKNFFGRAFIWCGLKLYDGLSIHSPLPNSKVYKLELNSIKSGYTHAFSYYDCQTDDARLVVTLAKDAQKRGATILTRTACIQAQRTKNVWTCQLNNSASNYTVKCKAIINAAGPWANQVVQIVNATTPYQLKFVKGSHIVIKNHHNIKDAFILMLPDERVMFVTPYAHNTLMIGTTDTPVDNLDNIVIDEKEIDYMLNGYNLYFNHTISKADIINTWSGVRPLIDSHDAKAQELSRDYKVELNVENHLPLVNIWGGKLTAHRLVAESCLHQLKDFFDIKQDWTANSAIIGSFKEPVEQQYALIKQQYTWLPDSLCQRYFNAYGNEIHTLLQGISSVEDLGECFGADLYRREVDYLNKTEWAQTAEDILWRRSKLGLCFTQEQCNQLENYLNRM